MLTIQIDSREKAKAITKIINEFDKRDVKHYVSKLYVGDYMSLDNPRLIIDRKQNLNEVVSNITQQHKRFIAEIKRAKEMEIKLIILIEHSKFIKSIDDVENWRNPRERVSSKCVQGKQLAMSMRTISERYGCEFMFCAKSETGSKIIKLLSGDSRDE